MFINNNNILTLVLDEDDFIFSNLKLKKVNKWYRNTEGFYAILISRHLKIKNTKFREFFRVNIDQFDFLLSLIKNEITLPPNKKPISSAEKLSIILR